MATFKYLAFNGQEKKISGYINATDQVEAISMLQSKGLNPLSVTQSEQKKSKIKISKRDLSIFTKQMSALLSAGMPLEKSLELLSLQTTNNKFSQVLLNIMEDVTEGNSLSSSLKKFPRIFDEIYTSTIYAGETSAALAEVFSDLSEYLDKETQIKSQVTGALVYPSILFFVSLAVIYALLTFVLPQVVEQFVSSNVSLPLLTQVLLNFSTVFPYLVFSLLGIFASCYLLLQSNFLSTEFKISVSKLFLKTPLFGQIILFDQTARFCSSMRLMTKAGLNTIDSLHIAKDTFKNKY
jgi:Type II secretory pathway, component PulF